MSVIFARYPCLKMAMCALILLSTQIQPAFAQYFEALDQGYALEDVTESNALLECSPAPDVIAAQDASRPGTSLSCLLTLRSNMRRRLEQQYIEDLDPFFGEQKMIPPPDWAGHAIKHKQAGYASTAGQVCIGIGIHYEEDEMWGLGCISSYLKKPDGSFVEVASHELGHEYIGTVFVLDANNDGLLDVIASWMTGAGSGGGVDLFTVLPDGSFNYFGESGEPTDYASSLWSAHGTVELTDYDNDGDWELQLTFPLFFSAAGYYYRDIVSFSEADNAWSWDPDFAPGYYESEDRFYAELYRQVKLLKQDPKKFRRETDDYYQQYTCTIDGESYSLVPFVNDDGSLNNELIEDLRLIVEGDGLADNPVGRIILKDTQEA